MIKVEAPGEGDPVRHLGLSDGPSTVYFRNFNRGKKSVVLNLKDPADREALLGLCDSADVFVETFRPGVMDRLGIGYAQLAARNPRIVYCSISAFGQSGPYRDRPSHDLGVEAVSGVLSVSEGRDGQPAIPAVAAADMVAALQGLAGILMALVRRQTTGQGDYLDISMHDSVVSASANLLGPALAEDRQQNAKHERTTGGSAFYQIYDTKDGAPHRARGTGDEVRPQPARRCSAAPELAALCEHGPGPHQQPVEQFLRETFRTRTRDEWVQYLSTIDVCFGELNTFPEALRDAHLNARGMILVDEPRAQTPWIHRSASRANRPSIDLHEPSMGEHGPADPRSPLSRFQGGCCSGAMPI